MEAEPDFFKELEEKLEMLICPAHCPRIAPMIVYLKTKMFPMMGAGRMMVRRWF